MDHKQFLATLTPLERQRLTSTSDRAGLLHLLGHFGAIAVCAAWIYSRAPLWPLMMLPLGVLLVFLFTLLHETSHHTPFATKRINSIVGHICGFVLVLPANWFRYFHLAHHRYTQVPGKDPELTHSKPETWRDYLIHISGMPVWVSQWRTVLRNALNKSRHSYVPEARKPLIRIESRIYLLGYGFLLGTSLFLANYALLYLWLIPILLGQPFLRLYLLAEHGHCAFVANMLENTRTTYTNRMLRTLAWNMPYHAEHHSYPAVPFHKLPELHALIEPHLRETENGYCAFHRSYTGALESAD